MLDLIKIILFFNVKPAIVLNVILLLFLEFVDLFLEHNKNKFTAYILFFWVYNGRFFRYFVTKSNVSNGYLI